MFSNIAKFATYRWIIARYGRREYEHDLAIAAVFKDEAPNLMEWLHFHSGVGVTHFFLYNNNSSDNYLEVLSPWLAEGRVTLIDWPRGNQRGAYTHCIRRVRAQCRWLAFIDIDEFLYSPSDRYLPDALREYDGCAAIFVYWIIFGSSGHETRPDGNVLDAYTRCLDAAAAAHDQFDHRFDNKAENYVTGWAKDGKSIVDPRKVRSMNPHRPRSLFTGEILDENRQPPLTRSEASSLSFERFRINHYWAKSTQELTQKLQKGFIANPRHPPKNLDRWLERAQCLNGSDNQDIQEVWGEIKRDRGL